MTGRGNTGDSLASTCIKTHRQVFYSLGSRGDLHSTILSFLSVPPYLLYHVCLRLRHELSLSSAVSSFSLLSQVLTHPFFLPSASVSALPLHLVARSEITQTSTHHKLISDH